MNDWEKYKAVRRKRNEMKIGGKIPIAKEVKAMTIEDLIAIAAKYDMYLSISLTPLNKEADEEDNQTEPKTGEWLEVDCFESEKHSVTDMRCSLCGKYASIVLPHRTRCVYNYCPNCGAKMGGEEK